MSIAYAHYLIPIVQDLDFVASTDDVERLIRELENAGWLDPAQDSYQLRHYQGTGRAKESVSRDDLAPAIKRAIAAGQHVVADLSVREPAEPAVDTFSSAPAGTALGPQQCWAAEIILCHRLCTLCQDSESSATLLCPSCRNDLLSAGDRSGAPWDDVAIEFEGQLDRCANCGDVASPRAVLGQSRSASDGSLREESAPLFRFALRVWSDAPPDDPAVTDPAVLEALRAATGKAFRAVGRWC